MYYRANESITFTPELETTEFIIKDVIPFKAFGQMGRDRIRFRYLNETSLKYETLQVDNIRFVRGLLLDSRFGNFICY